MNKFFDRIFILSIPGSTRMNATTDHLNGIGIFPERFDGYDASVTGLRTTHTYEYDHPGSGYIYGPKPINMVLSHQAIWRVCEYIDGESFLILEDDVRFREDWSCRFQKAIASLPSDWDLLYIGSCCVEDKPSRKLVGNGLFRVSYALCTHAYAVRKKALVTLRECSQKMYAPIDIMMCLHAIPKLKAFAILPRIADQFETEIHP